MDKFGFGVMIVRVEKLIFFFIKFFLIRFFLFFSFCFIDFNGRLDFCMVFNEIV